MRKRLIFIIASLGLVIFLLFFFLISSFQKRKAVPFLPPFPIPTAFQTATPTTNPSLEPVGQGPGEVFIKQQEEEIRQTRPDVHLKNKLPHEEVAFSMTAYPDPFLKQFRFTVAMKGQDNTKSKNDAYLWMKSTGLTGQQIQSLTITYLSDAVAKLKERLPYDGEHFSLDYDRDPDKTTAVIYDGSLGEEEFNAFLKTNGISDRSLINNLTILYR